MGYHFFGEEVNGLLHLSEEDFFHLTKVLRIKKDEHFQIVANDFLYDVTLSDPNTQNFIIHRKERLNSELTHKITLIYALPKGDKLDLVLRAAVELGVYEIILASTKNSVVKVSKDKEQGKLERYQKILKSAAMQAKRDFIPLIKGIYPFAEALAIPFDLKLIAYENSKEQDEFHFLSSFHNVKSVSLLVGSEGGFSENEVKQANMASYLNVSFGPRILRTETAVIFGLSMLNLYSRSK